MKKISINNIRNYSFLFFLILFSCSTEPGKYKVSGNIDAKDGLKVYRVVADINNQPQIIDSTVINSNKFEMNGVALTPSISFLQVESFSFSLPIIVEEGNVKVKIIKDDIGSSKISGTTSNDHFNEYKFETKEFVEAIDLIKIDIQKAAQEGNNALVKDFQDDYKNVQDQIYSYELEFLKRNYDSYLSIILLERFIASKVLSISEAIDVFNLMTERIQNSDIGVKLKSTFDNPDQPIDIGYYAPNFTAPNPDGQMKSLNDMLGKVTLLEFWASWCGPCRRENPNLVKIYKKYKDLGFNIIGVSLDKSMPQWTKAIEDDYLTWDHLSNLKFWQDPIARLYKVRAIPASFILDEKGLIVSKNLRGYQLEAKISELIKGN
ncbi:MAG: hypothetical protein CMC04_01625 [Flavobacteriaceae bacterium]|nr:hypothetical protein [Flavobacteriaceae bacterium]